MAYMFWSTEEFNQDIGSWDVSSVSDMKGMFAKAKSFNQDISSWNVSKVTNMTKMFYWAENFNQDISSWNVSNVTDMSYMFKYAKNFNQDIGAWDVSNVTNMRSMFEGTINFNQDIGDWDVSFVDDMYSIFSGATNFNQDLSTWVILNPKFKENLPKELIKIDLNDTNISNFYINKKQEIMDSTKKQLSSGISGKDRYNLIKDNQKLIGFLNSNFKSNYPELFDRVYGSIEVDDRER
jgi:surface protein